MEEIKPSGAEDDLAIEKGNILTDSDKDMLNQIANATRKTSDVKLFEAWEYTTPEHARGFLEALARYASDREAIVAYHVIQTVMPLK